MIIVAATANSGFVSYPASFTNVIVAETIGSPLSYSKDYMLWGLILLYPLNIWLKCLMKKSGHHCLLLIQQHMYVL